MFTDHLFVVFLFLSFIMGLIVVGLIVKLKRKKRFDVAKITLSDIDKMTGHEFEEYLYVLIKALGYETYLTKKSRDFGADLLFRDGEGQLTVVQAKRLSEKLGLEAVQQIYTAQAYYLAEKALIITTAEQASDPCRKLAAATKVKIIDREQLDETIKQFKRGRFEEAQEIVEDLFDWVDFKAEDSIEVIESRRGLVQAGEYFYKGPSNKKQSS